MPCFHALGRTLLYLYLQMSVQQHEPFQWWIIQQEVIDQILPAFIANHPTYTPVLYDAWHSSVSHTMSPCYITKMYVHEYNTVIPNVITLVSLGYAKYING